MCNIFIGDMYSKSTKHRYSIFPNLPNLQPINSEYNYISKAICPSPPLLKNKLKRTYNAKNYAFQAYKRPEKTRTLKESSIDFNYKYEFVFSLNRKILDLKQLNNYDFPKRSRKNKRAN
jgi:hypothetical protein